MRVCSTPGCGTLTTGGACPVHRAETRRRRGTTTEQGYGWSHQQRRAALIPAAIGTTCPDCGALMTEPSRMVADHSAPLSLGRDAGADRVHCRSCSDRQGGKLRHVL